MPDIFDSTDSQLVGAGATFVSVATANMAALGLVLGDITTLTTLNTGYANGYNAMITARDAAKAATQTKMNTRKALLADIRVLAKKIYANPSVPSNLIAQLGLPVHSTVKTPVIPVSPADLVAVGFANGENKLKWKRNGNAKSVIFWIEQSTDAVTWTLTATCTKTNFTQQDQTPGQTKYYRIRATAKELVSAPSNEAVVYPIGGQSLSLEQGGNQAAA